MTRYTHMRTNKGDLGRWKAIVGSSDGEVDPSYRLCGEGIEDGDHLMLRCGGRGAGRLGRKRMRSKYLQIVAPSTMPKENANCINSRQLHKLYQ